MGEVKMPRGISKDLENFKETLEKGVLLVGGEAVDNNSIDPDDDTPVSVAIVVNVQGYGPHVGAIAAVQGHIDEALQAAHEILEEWEQEHNPDHFKELEDEYGERASDILTETFDGVMWELPVEDFVAAIKGTAAEKYIDVVEYEEEENEEGEEEISERMSVEAGSCSPSTTGVDDALDVDFTLTLDGIEYEGEVTLLPREDGSPGYASWGSVEHWLDGRTLNAIRKLELPHNDERAVLGEIEAACAEMCE